MSRIADEIRAEANIAVRPGQMDRLNILADGIEKILSGKDDAIAAYRKTAQGFARAHRQQYDQIQDLKQRMTRAVTRLRDLHDEESKSEEEKARLAAKIEGVKLALSYLEDMRLGFPASEEEI